MSVDINILKQLRESTGAGMSACKSALEEAKNDFDSAVKILREKGIASAAKKADREAKEGLCGILVDGNKATALHFACETDFVARNEKFQNFVTGLLTNAHKSSQNTVEAISEENKDKIAEHIGVMGENMFIVNVGKLEAKNGVIAHYIHSQATENLGRIVTAIIIESTGDKTKLLEMGKKVCMHIAAMNPEFLSEKDVTDEFKNSELEIYKKQMEGSGKPENVIEKIIQGKLNKTLQDKVLLQQEFCIDTTVTVGDFVKNSAKELGSDISLTKFIRFSI